MTQGLLIIIIITGCVWLLLDEFTGSKRISQFVKGLTA